jgi:hypothetical protein
MFSKILFLTSAVSCFSPPLEGVPPPSQNEKASSVATQILAQKNEFAHREYNLVLWVGEGGGWSNIAAAHATSIVFCNYLHLTPNASKQGRYYLEIRRLLPPK